MQGQMLHAKSIEFAHPISGEILKIEAPLPEYFENVIEKISSL